MSCISLPFVALAITGCVDRILEMVGEATDGDDLLHSVVGLPLVTQMKRLRGNMSKRAEQLQAEVLVL